MLVRPDGGDGALVIGQLSHSWLSGQLARAWGNARFGELAPREEIVLGAQQHDIGWAAADLRPRFDPASGLPQSFLDLTVPQYLAIWRDVPSRLMSQSAHAALLISLHASSLACLRAERAPEHIAAIQPHIDAEHARQTQLGALLGVSAFARERLRLLMWAWDRISLALCNDWLPYTIDSVPARDGLVSLQLAGAGGGGKAGEGGEGGEGGGESGARGDVTVDPWPFTAQRVEVRCEARRLIGRFAEEVAMRAALADAAPFTLTFTLVPGR